MLSVISFIRSNLFVYLFATNFFSHTISILILYVFARLIKYSLII